MQTARRRPVCVASNSFRIDRVLQKIYFPSAPIGRPVLKSQLRHIQYTLGSTTLKSHRASIGGKGCTTLHLHATGPSRSAEDVVGANDEQDKERARKLLRDALSVLRRRNRGTDSVTF